MKAFLTALITIATFSPITSKEYCEVRAHRPDRRMCEYDIYFSADDPRNTEGETERVVDIINMMEEKGYNLVSITPQTVQGGTLLERIIFVKDE